MEFHSNYNSFIKLGLLIIGLAGFIFAWGDAYIPDAEVMFQATGQPEAFSNLVTTDGFAFWSMRGMVGIPMELIGTIALFLALVSSPLEKWAFLGMVLCLLADLFGFGLFAILYYMFPQVGELYVGGSTAAITLASVDEIMPLFVANFLLTSLGLILFAAAIWRSNVLPRWSGIVAVIGWLMLLVQGSYLLQISANLIWGAAYIWMSISVWNNDFQTSRS